MGIFELQLFAENIYGTSSSEYITVTGSEIAVYGYGGNDTIVNDRWNSPKNSITISGGDGNDSIISNYGSNPSIVGGYGNDYLKVRGADAFISSDNGNDVIHSDSKNATADGGSGNDYIYSYGDNVSIYGGADSDTISIAGGNNVSASGGYGDDKIILSRYAAAIVQYSTGDGDDTVTGFSDNDTLQIAGDSYTTTESGKDIIVGVGSGSVTLKDAKNVSLNIKISNNGGNSSINKISNSTDYKRIIGTSGKDSVYNSGDYVKISTGKGNDYIYSDYTNGVSIYGGTGNDTIDSYAGYGNDGNWTTIKGGAGKDSIRNFGGDSVISNGGSGNDYIYDYGNYNTIYGGTGRDYIYLDESLYSYVFGGKGNDTIISGRGDITRDTSHATISGGTGNDKISLSFDSYNNVIKYASGDGKDTIYGFNYDDVLHITSGSYKTKVSGNDVIVTVGKGRIILKDAVGRSISIEDSEGEITTKNYGSSSANVAELFAENNFVTSDNLSEIVENNLSPTAFEKIEMNNFENLTDKNNLITYSE